MRLQHWAFSTDAANQSAHKLTKQQLSLEQLHTRTSQLAHSQ